MRSLAADPPGRVRDICRLVDGSLRASPRNQGGLRLLQDCSPRVDGSSMKTLSLSKWQVEILREAFAILARAQESQNRFKNPEAPSPQRVGKANQPRGDEMFFAI